MSAIGVNGMNQKDADAKESQYRHRCISHLVSPYAYSLPDRNASSGAGFQGGFLLPAKWFHSRRDCSVPWREFPQLVFEARGSAASTVRQDDFRLACVNCATQRHRESGYSQAASAFLPRLGPAANDGSVFLP